MSQENVELVRRWIWAFENDTDTFREITHPEIEWAPFEENHTPSYGLDGAMRIRDGWFDAWAEHRMEIEEVFDGDDDLVASLHVTARGKESGVEVDVRLHGHMKVRDGRVIYLFEYEDLTAALAAAGLSDPRPPPP
jgi:ketosteroid isomerase-like protein